MVVPNFQQSHLSQRKGTEAVPYDSLSNSTVFMLIPASKDNAEGH